jgi:hypothetical protein
MLDLYSNLNINFYMERQIIYSAHVVIQMFKRGITEEDIEHVLNAGVIIKDYPDDKPYPSFLILGYKGNIPLHIVYAVNEIGESIIITAYQPDNTLWNNDYTVKKK